MIDKIKQLIENNQRDLAKQLLTSLEYNIQLSKNKWKAVRSMICQYFGVDDEFTSITSDDSFYKSSLDWEVKMIIGSCYDEYDAGEWLGCEGEIYVVEYLGYKSDINDYCCVLNMKHYSDQAGGMLSNYFKVFGEKQIIYFNGIDFDDLNL